MKLKYLTEQRSENQEQMQKILDTAKLEKRALSEKEISKFNELKKLIDEIDATIKAEDEARKMDMEENKKEASEETVQKENESTEKEERAFVDFIVTGEERANSPGMSYGSNGAIVPTTIAKKIIEKYRGQGFRYFDLFSSDEKTIRYARNQLNTTIKSVCKKANLDTEQNYTAQIGTKLVVQRQKLYAMIHTQTARHTFITLMCKLGVPKENVIIATAHTDTKMIDNVYLHETVCERGQRLVESYREIKQSHFFVVESQPQESHKHSIIKKLTHWIVNLVKKC